MSACTHWTHKQHNGNLFVLRCRQTNLNAFVHSSWSNERCIQSIDTICCSNDQDLALIFLGGASGGGANAIHFIQECRKDASVHAGAIASVTTSAERTLVRNGVELIKEEQTR